MQKLAIPKRKYRRLATPKKQICLICDAEFNSIRSDAQTCSARCRKTLQRDPIISEINRSDRAWRKFKELSLAKREYQDHWRAIRQRRHKRRVAKQAPRDIAAEVIRPGSPPLSLPPS
jgi:hypothetical protein